VAVKQEVIAHHEQHVHVGFCGKSAEQVREARLQLQPTERKQLLELIRDDQCLRVLLAPAADPRECLLGILDLPCGS